MLHSKLNKIVGSSTIWQGLVALTIFSFCLKLTELDHGGEIAGHMCPPPLLGNEGVQ
jgi:hypothetical protein